MINGGHRVLHLHLGHDGPAQGLDHVPLPVEQGDGRLRPVRRATEEGRRPAQSAADVSRNNALTVALSCVLASGACLAIEEHFSAIGVEFWDQARATGATAAIYIGEICRYLLLGSRPGRPRPLDPRDDRRAARPESGTSSRSASASAGSASSTPDPVQHRVRQRVQRPTDTGYAMDFAIVDYDPDTGEHAAARTAG